MVYLTDTYAAFFAMGAADTDEKPLILEIAADELNPDYCYPDEDFIAQALAHQRHEPLESVHDEVRSSIEAYQHHWPDSLQAMGTMAYRAWIPPSAITRYCVFDPLAQSQVGWAAIDPCISPLNYRFCGAKYRSLTHWLFGDREDWCMGFTDNEQWFEMMRGIDPGVEESAKAGFKCRDGIEVVNLRGKA